VHLVDGRLRRTSRDGAVGTAAGMLEDYGCLAEGLLALHQATGAQEWLEIAVQLLDTALARFADPTEAGVFHDTADDAEKLVGRPADVSDNASPAGASSLAGALLTASALVGYDKAARYREAAEAAVTRAGLLVARAPRFAGHWLTVAEAIAQGPLQVAIATAHGDPRGESLRDVALAHVPGGAVVLAGEPDSVPLLADRPLIYDAPAAYVCRGYVCDRPVSSTDELLVALERR
jgi:uncharacterized protein YyaL (SSP411 family)